MSPEPAEAQIGIACYNILVLASLARNFAKGRLRPQSAEAIASADLDTRVPEDTLPGRIPAANAI